MENFHLTMNWLKYTMGRSRANQTIGWCVTTFFLRRTSVLLILINHKDHVGTACKVVDETSAKQREGQILSESPTSTNFFCNHYRDDIAVVTQTTGRSNPLRVDCFVTVKAAAATAPPPCCHRLISTTFSRISSSLSCSSDIFIKVP